MRLRENADRRAAASLQLQKQQLAIQAQDARQRRRESNARIARMGRTADPSAAVDQLAQLAQSGILLTPEQRAVLKPGEREIMVPWQQGGKAYFRSALGPQQAARYNDTVAAFGEATAAMKQLEPFLALDQAGKPRPHLEAGVSSAANRRNQAIIDSAYGSLTLALGKLAKAGDLSAAQREAFEKLAVQPQGWGTTDETERGSYDALDARIQDIMGKVETQTLVPMR